MATGEASLGLVGLTHSVNKREAARQDLATMGQLVQMKKEQDAQEQQAALVEQQYYEQIRQQAEQMLAGDRKRINERAKSLQGQIREQIKAFGGSRSKFMASGGLAMLGDYTRNVLDSKEVALYKQNKINLEKLLDIKEKGMGGLISAKDQTALEDYQKNGFGEITYSGLKNNIELPAETNYYEGQYATPMDILLFKNNKMKILANYKIDNPDVPIESYPLQQREAILRQYTALNYSVRGSKAIPQSAYGTGSGNKTNASGKLTEDGYYTTTIGGELFTHKAKFSKDLTLEDMKTNVFEKNPYATEVFGNVKYNKKSKIDPTIMNDLGDIVTIPVGNKWLWDWDEDNTFAPRGAMDLGANIVNPLWKVQNGADYIIEKGVIKDIDPKALSNLMWGNGVPIRDKEKADLKTGDYKIKGAFMGYEMNARGQNYLVVDAYTEDGNLDEGRNADMYVNEDPNNPAKGRQEIFLELEDPDGMTIYQKVDYSGTNHPNLLNGYLEDMADLSDQYAEDRGNVNKITEAEQLTGGQRRAQATMNIDHDGFDSNPVFNEQVKFYNNYANTGNRINLLKGFYTALYDLKTNNNDKNLVDMENLIQQNSFGQFIYGLGLDNKVKDPRISDMDFYNLMRQTILSKEQSSTPTEVENNTFLMDMIKNYIMKSRAPRQQNPKAEQGANFGFTPGSEWQVVKDFKGPSHSGGGIDVNVNNL